MVWTKSKTRSCGTHGSNGGDSSKQNKNSKTLVMQHGILFIQSTCSKQLQPFFKLMYVCDLFV